MSSGGPSSGLRGPEGEGGSVRMEFDGDDIPPFANESNKRLDAAIKQKKARLVDMEEQITEVTERVQTMTSHLKNVQQECQHTQALVEAKNKEIETEEHMTHLAKRQAARLGAELKRLEGLMEEYQDRMNTNQNEIFKGNEKLDQFKLEMNWNQEELEQWAVAARQKEEDNLTMDKYHRADEQKIRDLNLAVQKLTMEASEKKDELEKEVTETQAAQIELERTAEQFKKLHIDRHALIKQWEDAVTAMRKRDEAIRQAGEHYAALQNDIKVQQQKLGKAKAFLAQERATNDQVETEIGNTDRQLAKLRLEYMDSKNGLVEFKDEVEVLRNQLAGAATELTNRKNKLASVTETLEEKKKKWGVLQKKVETTNKKLENEIKTAADKESYAREAEALHAEMDYRMLEAEKELKKVKEELFKQNSELYALRNEEATTLGEISGAQSSLKTLSFQIHKLDQERQRQQELLYAVDFQSQLMQRKVARVSGERTFEEKEELNKKIDQLEKQLEEQAGLWQILSTQIKRVDAELRQSRRDIAAVTKDGEGLKTVLDEMNLESKSLKRALQNAQKERADLLVTHDLLKLDVNRLRESLNAQSEEVFALENKKFQLQMTMEEREKKVEVHQEILRAQQCSAEEEKSKIAKELGERRSKINILKSKYESVMARMKKEEGEEHSQAYFIIKAAQEQEELQRQGDELDAQIRRQEKEIRALENTLGHLLERNHRFKDNFKKADAAVHAEADEKKQLEKEVRSANEQLFEKKRTLNEIEKEYDEDERRLYELKKHKERIQLTLQELSHSKNVLEKELADQEDKIDRAFKSMQQRRRAAKEAGKMSDATEQAHSSLELDAQSVVLKDQNQAILHAIATCLQEQPDTLHFVQQIAQQRGLHLPSRAPSATPSQGSVRNGDPGRGAARPGSAGSQGAINVGG
ncbi:unnamed protein product [Vitrella brassicaformis CCMP3155]|uniref:Coiled-coil domain-containing protein 39 n=1 Tax=Vitrella brassicaformis (strain CCMP3155) TaxID=1169540 RepID=A0A0G4EN79_VITBC|nr:unnamed protein product [Vitrella brassicaformis CCMP3155]|mmetsp:Transcript_35387/g.87941  ORF Transcript_35387/g.87941 Transcript_35387/m.87941 type:complete len:925 (-) Transcript_35387:2141-4915(-)|eukprot:CEL98484.1 unnamed protein product [Vitrella brassicaformis CCMP3155]